MKLETDREKRAKILSQEPVLQMFLLFFWKGMTQQIVVNKPLPSHISTINKKCQLLEILLFVMLLVLKAVYLIGLNNKI